MLLGLMMILAPGLGVPSQELLQDTLKSGIVALMTLSVGLLFLWMQRQRQSPVIWHGLMWLPLGLAVYALGSMVWSHTYLGGVEAARWLVLSLLLWLGMNTQAEDLESRMLWGIHWGVTIASIWTAWQFWGNFDVFPQGPNPASTFINRNFFAEYAVCALPYSLLLLLRVRDFREALSLAAGIAFNIAALMMTGTRSALFALLVLCALLPLQIYRCRSQLAITTWGRKKNSVIAAVFAGCLLAFGSIPTANPRLIHEFGAQSAISRAVLRAASVGAANEYTTGSFSVRSVMWAATARMAIDHPVTGVGAGAWEVDVPLYQNGDTVTETDYYAHNEFLQLLSEYGLTGALFIGLLIAYLLISAYRTWTNSTDTATAYAPLRTSALVSLLMLLIVSNFGFPWRMACTGALFALSLSLLAATDAAAGSQPRWLMHRYFLQGMHLKLALGIGIVCLVLAVYISQRAASAERKLVRSIQLALAISGSPDPRSPKWDSTKSQLLEMVKEGIALNPHYRKITPVVADQLASWGDWKNALWIWESVQASRPHVIAIACNISKAHMELGNLEAARLEIKKAQQLNPTSKAVFALDIELLLHEGQALEAKQLLEPHFQNDTVDENLALLALKIGTKTQDGPLVVRALEWRIRHKVGSAVDAWLRLGAAYDQRPDIRDPDKALAAYRAALEATPERYKEMTRQRTPAPYRALLPTP